MTDEAGGDDKVLCVPAGDHRRDHLRTSAIFRVPPARDRALLHRLQGPRARQVGRRRNLDRRRRSRGRGPRQLRAGQRTTTRSARTRCLILLPIVSRSHPRALPTRRSPRSLEPAPAVTTTRRHGEHRISRIPTCLTGIPGPDALIIGAPKAGHERAARGAGRSIRTCTPQPIKEPKYYMCGDARRRLTAGPGDAHSQQEWIWRRAGLRRPVRGRAGGHPVRRRARRSTSTTGERAPPDRRGAARRQADRHRPRPDRPGVLELDAPVGRRARAGAGLRRGARSRGRAGRRRAGRRSGTTARLGMYGEQLADLLRPRRPRAGAGAALPRLVVEAAPRRWTGSCRFLGVAEGELATDPAGQLPAASSQPGLRTAVLGPAIRAGAAAGRFVAAAGLAARQPAADRRAAARRRDRRARS